MMAGRNLRTDEPIHTAGPKSPQPQAPQNAGIRQFGEQRRAVLLLHPGLIVLPIWPATCELNISLLAVRLHGLVQEYAVIVRVEPEQRKRHSLADLAQNFG